MPNYNNFNNRNNQRVPQNAGFNNGRNQQAAGNGQRADASSKWNELNWKSTWITQEVDEDFVTFAEKAGEFMAENGLTNSKIRSVYGEIKRIQTSGWENNKASFYLLKPKMAYAVGRDKQQNRNNASEGLLLFQRLFNECFGHVKNETHYNNLCNLVEGVLAYHKAFGGKD